MDLVTVEQMRQLDRITIEGLSIPAVALMENAGRAIAEEVIALCRSRHGGGAGGEDRNGGRAGTGGGWADADIAGRGGYINGGPGAENGRDAGTDVGRGGEEPGAGRGSGRGVAAIQEAAARGFSRRGLGSAAIPR